MRRWLFLLDWLAAVILAGACCANAGESQRPANRNDSLKALCQRLDIGPSAVVADVGCGDGPDTMLFASVVGERGTVLAQEIDIGKLKKVIETADKRGFHQVVPVLGQSDDPRLPDGLASLIYMNRVFHHFARPQAMLQRLWHDLRPGGYLVIVDQQKGPLTDWAPVASREKEHHWTGETTVVRLAREAGFVFHDTFDDLWYEKPPFVLAFRKPADSVKPTVDPDLPRPLELEKLINALPLAQVQGAVAFCGLDRGRTVGSVLKEKLPSSSRFFDVIPEEWALSREELPAEASQPGVEILRTDKGNVSLPADDQLGLVLFADSYHRLWDPAPLLRRFKEQMAGPGVLVVLDRQGPETESRRLANHRRRISSSLVTEEMRQAGFRLQRTLPAPTEDRFLLLFGLESPSSP